MAKARPGPAGRWSCDGGRPGLWKAGRRAVTPTSSRSSAATAVMIPAWTTVRSHRRCNGSADPIPTLQASQRTSSTPGGTQGRREYTRQAAARCARLIAAHPSPARATQHRRKDDEVPAPQSQGRPGGSRQPGCLVGAASPCRSQLLLPGPAGGQGTHSAHGRAPASCGSAAVRPPLRDVPGRPGRRRRCRD